MKNLRTILRCINAGEKTILQDIHGNYISNQVDNWQTREWLKDYEEVDIESRLKFELYGEYPLSDIDENDYLRNIKPLFINKL